MFSSLADDLVRVDDPKNDFTEDLVLDRFMVDGNGVMRKCRCGDNSEFQDNLDGNFAEMFMETSLCYTNHMPPIFGPREKICNGSAVKNAQEVQEKWEFLKEEAIAQLQGHS